MQRAESFRLSFSTEHPITILNPLRMILQHILANPALHSPKIQAYLNMRTIYLIDTHQQRATYLAQLLTTLGFHPLVTSTPLEAYTLYLQGFTVPFTLLVGQEDTSQRFFLQRLSQHMQQKYHYEIPIIYLQTVAPAPATPRLAPPALLPAPSPSQPPIPSPSTAPLPAPMRTAPLVPTPHMLPLLPPAPVENQAPIPETSLQETTTEAESREKEHLSLTSQNLGRYQIIAPLGHKEHSNVYQTYDRLRESNIAIKALPMNSALPQDIHDTLEEEYNRFQHEKEIMSHLKHPHIVPVLNSGKSYISGIPFIYKTMPYYTDGSLANWLYQRRGMTFPPQDILHIIAQLGDALQYAHTHDVLYQNFKFTNILISKSAKNLRGLHVLLSDFTIDLTQSTLPNNKDSFPYVAPERWQEQVFPASDQYGLAAMAYELLAGRPLFQGQSATIIKQLHLSMTPPAPSSFNPSVSPTLDRVLLRALAKHPTERFPSVSAFVTAFQQSC
jgi:hypothetical protein